MDGISRKLVLLSAASIALGTAVPALGAPGDILFTDNFNDGNLAPWTTTNATISGVQNGGQTSGSNPGGAYTSNAAVTVTSPTFNTAVPAAEISIWVRRGSDQISEEPDNNENLVFEYRRADNSWGTLNQYLGSGTAGQIYQNTFQLPADGLHANYAIRLRQTAGSGFDFDYWHFDDTIVTETTVPQPFGIGGCEDFELGLAGNWTVNAGSGFAGTSSATSQSPTNSLYTNGGTVDVTSNIIDTSNGALSNVTVWVRRGADSFSEDPDGGENLVIEYLNDVGAWIALESFNGPGGGGQIFNRSYFLPAAGRHANFQIRFRQTGGSGAGWDYWHVDDVCFDTQTLPDIMITKVAQTLSDPINGATNPFAIPGAIKEYTIAVANGGAGTVDADTLVLTDALGADTAMYVDTGAGDPVVFQDGAITSGLSYNYATDVSYSSQVGGVAPYNYIPTPDADGFDALVTGLRIAPTGTMDADNGGGSPSFTITFRIRVQ